MRFIWCRATHVYTISVLRAQQLVQRTSLSSRHSLGCCSSLHDPPHRLYEGLQPKTGTGLHKLLPDCGIDTYMPNTVGQVSGTRQIYFYHFYGYPTSDGRPQVRGQTTNASGIAK